MDKFIDGLEYVYNFIEEMKESSSGNYKKEILKKHKDNDFLKKVFYYTYHDFKKYGVHSKNLKKRSDLIKQTDWFYNDFFVLLEALAESKLTGHTAISTVNGFIKNIPEKYHDLLYCIIDGDLKIGSSIKTILKVHPNLVPTFNVALAQKYAPKRVDFKNEIWYGSRKLDGVRCICIKEGDKINFYSRSGKEFLTLQKIRDEINKLPGDFVMDGEICLVDENGNEDFQGIMKEIRRKNHIIQNPKFFIFDYLTLEDFSNKESTAILSKRLSDGYKLINNNHIDHNKLDFLNQEIIKNEEHFKRMAADAEDNGYEGIMVRKDSIYEGKRSYNLLKVKKFHDAEYVVIDTENSIIRWVEDGRQIEKECLSNIIVEHKGNLVSIGSGFSKEQRELYYTNPEKIIGKTVCIKYFEESKNSDGNYSLRFPVIKHIYENKRDC